MYNPTRCSTIGRGTISPLRLPVSPSTSYQVSFDSSVKTAIRTSIQTRKHTTISNIERHLYVSNSNICFKRKSNMSLSDVTLN